MTSVGMCICCTAVCLRVQGCLAMTGERRWRLDAQPPSPAVHCAHESADIKGKFFDVAGRTRAWCIRSCEPAPPSPRSRSPVAENRRALGTIPRSCSTREIPRCPTGPRWRHPGRLDAAPGDPVRAARRRGRRNQPPAGGRAAQRHPHREARCSHSRASRHVSTATGAPSLATLWSARPIRAKRTPLSTHSMSSGWSAASRAANAPSSCSSVDSPDSKAR